MYKFRVALFEELDELFKKEEDRATAALITHELNDAKFHYNRGCRAQIVALRVLLIEEDKRQERD